MTYRNPILDLDYVDDEIRRAQNKAKSEWIEKNALPTIRSLELDSPVEAEYHAIDTYISFVFTCRRLNRENNNTYHIKWL